MIDDNDFVRVQTFSKNRGQNMLMFGMFLMMMGMFYKIMDLEDRLKNIEKFNEKTNFYMWVSAYDGNFDLTDQWVYNIQEVDGKIDSLRNQIYDLRQKFVHELSRVQYSIAKKPSYEDLPISPNLLKDTKNFEKFGTSDVWETYYWNTELQEQEYLVSGTDIEAAVVKITDEQVITSLGLKDQNEEKPWGDLQDIFETNDEISILVIDLKNYDTQRQIHFMYQESSKDQFVFPVEISLQYGVFIKILDHKDTLQLNFFDAITVDKDTQGITERWTHLNAVKQGTYPSQKAYTSGVGKLRVAIALPYIAYGNSGGKYTWVENLQTYLDSTEMEYSKKQ